jgi:hypothetical protein
MTRTSHHRRFGNSRGNRRGGGGRGASAPVDAPVNSVPPAITGTVLIGETLTCSSGTWSGSPSFAYQWERDGVEIADATASTYDVTASDIGPQITCVVTATNAGGSASSESAAVIYADETHLPLTSIGVSSAGITAADAGTTVQSWAASLGGIAATLAAPGSTNRPARGSAGGFVLVTFDGTDDVLTGTLTKGSAFDTCEMGFVGSRVAFGTAGDLAISYSATGTTPHFSIQDASVDTALRFSGAANAQSTTDPDGTVAHYSGDAQTSTWNMRVAGTVEATASAAVTSRADGGSLSLGGRPAATNSGNYAMRAWYCGPVLTATQRTHLRALLSYHTGVAC